MPTPADHDPIALTAARTPGVRPPRSRRATVVILALLLPIALFIPPTRATPAPETPVLSAEAMLQRWSDPHAAARPLPPGFRAIQISSHDRTGGNIDGGWYTKETVDSTAFHVTGVHPPHPTYVRQDEDGVVLLDERGPGCLTRMWFTAFSSEGEQGDVSIWGDLQVSIDGDEQPRFDVPLAELVAGADPRFPPPLVGNREVSSGGNYAYIPICYRERLVLRTTGVPENIGGWHILQLVKAPAGTPVEVFDPDTFDASEALARIDSADAPPRRPPDRRVTVELGDTTSGDVLTAHGAGTVEHLRLRVHPFDINTLRDIELVVSVDGTSEPQIRSPLAPLFGDGGTVRDIATPGFGMRPDHATGYLGYPIAYDDGLRIRLAARNDISARVTAEVWQSGPRPQLGTLHIEHHEKPMELGRDYRVLQASGAGHLVGWVLDLVGRHGSSSKNQAFFLEGDERAYVDGARSVAYYGTGTEDTFNGGFYYTNGAFALPTHGAGPFGTDGMQGTQSQYRSFGGDTWNWSSAIDLGMEHGGNNERPGGTATSTTFSYRRPGELVQTDHVDFGDPTSEQSHHVSADLDRVKRTAYFEGRHDGTIPASAVVVGGLYYPSAPPAASSEAVTDDGVTFEGPLEFQVAIAPDNHGVVLRRLIDVGEHPSALRVVVNGEPVTVWSVPRTNPAKRWLETDLDLPASVTKGHRYLDVRLVPLGDGPENLHDLRVFSRRRGVPPGGPG